MNLRMYISTFATALLAMSCSNGMTNSKSVTLVTHDSFAISAPVLKAFERESGIDVRVLKGGDAGEVLNQAILTKGAPLGDVLFGVDNTFLARALDANIFVPHKALGLDDVSPALRIDPTHHATPIDWGDVCINTDITWFAKRGIDPPKTLADLLDPRFRGLLVVENPATSSPGLAFLLATIASSDKHGWQNYWKRLRDNDVLVVDGWEQAYNTEFSGSAGKGSRPLVVSYATSPAAEVMFADPPITVAPTGNIDTTCFRQIEMAGILKGAKHPKEARALIDFLVSEQFQKDVPTSMFVYPARSNTPLPEAFEQFAPPPTASGSLPPSEISANRDEWIERWTEIVLR